GYSKANIISDNEANMLNNYEKSKMKDDFLTSVKSMYFCVQNGKDVAFSLLAVLPKLKDDEGIQYALTLIDDLIPSKRLLFERENINNIYYKVNHRILYYRFVLYESITIYLEQFRMMKKEDVFISLKAATIFTSLASIDHSFPESEFESIIEWIAQNITSDDKERVMIASQILPSLLRIEEFKITCSKNSKFMSSLVKALKGESNPQIQYQIIVSLWMLTFVEEIAQTLQSEHQVLPVLIDIIKGTVKEKVIRATLSLFRNMLEKAKAENMHALIGAKTLSVIETLAGRKFTDEDITNDIKFLGEELRNVFNTLSSFDEYVSELRSGKLEWSPPHQSELFWKQNVIKFNEKDFEVLNNWSRILIRILATSEDPTVLSVACNDIGNYAKFYPNGRRYLQELGAKQKVMKLMSHENSEVKYHALMSVQNLMTNVWNNQ
ncbi:ARM repeat-containing protein, partial [Rozella allomycis CSF55]